MTSLVIEYSRAKHKPARQQWQTLRTGNVKSYRKRCKLTNRPLAAIVQDICDKTKYLKTYKDYKMAATRYQTAWQQLLRVYQTWKYKPPGHLSFT